MAGFFDDIFNPSDPTSAAKLQAAFSLLGQQGYGNAGMAGLNAAMKFKQSQAEEQRRKLQDQLMQYQLGGLQREQEIASLPQQFMRPGQMPPTMDARDIGTPGAPEIPAQQFDQQGYIQALMGKSPMAALQYEQAITKQAPQPIKLGQGDQLLDPRTFQPLANNPKTDTGTTDMQNYAAVKAQGYQGTLSDFLKEQANLKAPRTSVTVPVNLGQKGFDNTLKLRGDFRSEPIYKAHQEVQSAYSQIQQSLKQASPAGDLAGATKIMKLLDPGSVVRESELGMAMAATGALDRVQNYAQTVIKGTKLTPSQRKDFQTLADALYGESVKQYNAKRAEYKGIVDRNQLNEADVLGTESPAPAGAVRKYNPATGRIE